jgi:hypothetical protein
LPRKSLILDDRSRNPVVGNSKDAARVVPAHSSPSGWEVQMSRRRLAMTHRHGRNINAHPTRGFFKGTVNIFSLSLEERAGVRTVVQSI